MTVAAPKARLIASIRSRAELEGYRQGIAFLGRALLPGEAVALAECERRLVRAGR